MLIARAPLRISFLGGGTDYPEYFDDHGGEVLSTTIDKFSYVSLSKLLEFFDHRIRLSYSKTELVACADDIEHRAVRAALKFCGIDGNVELNCMADLPARTGLGSSGSFLVALLHALHVYKREPVNLSDLGHEAIQIEREILGDNVGCQDQYAAAVGGFNVITFKKHKQFEVKAIRISNDRRDQLDSNLLMFYTGQQRSATEIAEEQVKRTNINLHYLNQLKALVAEGRSILESKSPLIAFGELLDESWRLKQSLSTKISNGLIDEIYAVGKKAGAIGGKLLGAGGGGFLLFYVEQNAQADVRKALSTFKEVPFNFEPSGSRIVYQMGLIENRSNLAMPKADSLSREVGGMQL